MTFAAKVIEDSRAMNGKRLSTLQLQYPRFIHAEAKTHRVIKSGDCLIELLQEVSLMDDPNLSRNASSSRAIPVNKMVERTLADPAYFAYIGKNQPGMSAKEEVSEDIKAKFKGEWDELGRIVAEYTLRWANEYQIHKQTANRALEPWQHIHVIVTATEWDNFFELRDHADAQPEIKVLATLMRKALNDSIPVLRPTMRYHESGWHLPYVTAEERLKHEFDPAFLAKLSGARCARVSYLNHDGSTPSQEKDLQLYTDLVGGRPLHASPVEHQGYPMPRAEQASKNFLGWRQNREIVELEVFK